jgi:hypothetical protein
MDFTCIFIFFLPTFLVVHCFRLRAGFHSGSPAAGNQVRPSQVLTKGGFGELLPVVDEAPESGDELFS